MRATTGYGVICRYSSMPTNFAKRLKTFKGLTVCEFITQKWASEPQRFRLNPNQLIPGSNI
jgi:hypothetical protein